MKRGDLPKQLTAYQAVAWVCYRHPEAVSQTEDPLGLSGLKFYSKLPCIGTSEQLLSALLEGTLTATGETLRGEFQPIRAIEWTALPLAPRIEERQHPYRRIFIDRDQLLKRFVPPNQPAQRGRPRVIDWDWLEAKAKLESETRPGKLAEILRALYRQEFGREISLSGVKSRLKAWGY